MAPESPTPDPARPLDSIEPCNLVLAQTGYEMVQAGLALIAQAMPNPPADLNPMDIARHSRLQALRAMHAAIRSRREHGIPWDVIAREFGGRQTAEEMRTRFEEAAEDITLDVDQDTPEHRSAAYAALAAFYAEVSAAAAHTPEGTSPQADPLQVVAS